MHYNQTAVQ